MQIAARSKLIIYSSVFMALAVNAPMLFTLRENRPFAGYNDFNFYEFVFRIVYSCAYCAVFLYFNSGRQFYTAYPALLRRLLLVVLNIIAWVVFARIGYAIDRALFQQPINLLPRSGYGLRLGVSAVLMAIELKIVGLLNANKQKELENQYLRNAYLNAELEVLKGQLNPHFLFNALSSLSGVVREDAVKAQQYIGQLSKFFRYTLQKTSTSLVPLGDEVEAIQNYFAILKMRYEEGVAMDIQIDRQYAEMLMPHMSLQPLIENAVKHNQISAARPLFIKLYVDEQDVIVVNHLQLRPVPEPGSGIGLANLNERYRILTGKEIVISQTDTEFIVRLPLTSHGA